jgi:hypothetical protein
MQLKQISSRSLALVLSVLMCNAPQLLAAQTTNGAQQNSQPVQASGAQNSDGAATTDQTDAQGAAMQNSTRPDPSQAPLAPVPSNRPADTSAVPPDAPSAVQQSQQQQQTQAPAAQPQPTQQQTNPLGTATAQQGTTRGGAASRPAGTAIAPAKQRQVHSMLIKLGLVAAGAAAIGTVVGLTKGTSSTPPGAR